MEQDQGAVSAKTETDIDDVGPKRSPGSALENSSPRFTLSHGLAEVGFYFSAAYLTFLAAMAMFSWDMLWSMQPNEFGDLMAGVFAPLAFLWLVLGFFQQGQELRNSGEALWLQMEELRNSVEQQKGLVEATKDLREQEARIYLEQQAEAARAASPILRVRPRVDVSMASGMAQRNFSITNSGRDCYDLIVWINSEASARFARVEGGQTVSFTHDYAFEGSEQMKLDLTYVDARGVQGARKFFLNREGRNFEVEEATKEE